MELNLNSKLNLETCLKKVTKLESKPILKIKPNFEKNPK